MKSYKCLICDDDEVTRMAVSTMLVEGGLTVVGDVDNGKDAISECIINTPDILFLDINMPEYDGFYVAEKLLAANPSVKIVMLSGASTLTNVRKAMKMGVKGFIVKPFTIEKILAEVERVMRH